MAGVEKYYLSLISCLIFFLIFLRIFFEYIYLVSCVILFLVRILAGSLR